MLDGRELFEEVQRGQCVYAAVHYPGKPSEQTRSRLVLAATLAELLGGQNTHAPASLRS